MLTEPIFRMSVCTWEQQMTACNLMRYRMFCWSPRRRSRKKKHSICSQPNSQPAVRQPESRKFSCKTIGTHTHISCSRAMCERAHVSSPTQRAPSIHANRHTGLSHTQTRTRSLNHTGLFVWLQFVCLCLCVLFMCFQVTIFRDNLEAPLNSHTYKNIHAHSETVAKGITFHTFVMKKHWAIPADENDKKKRTENKNQKQKIANGFFSHLFGVFSAFCLHIWVLKNLFEIFIYHFIYCSLPLPPSICGIRYITFMYSFHLSFSHFVLIRWKNE